MKNLILFISSVTLLFVFSTNPMSASPNEKSTDSIQVYTTPGLLNISNIWVSEYQKIKPELNIKVSDIPMEVLDIKIKASGNIGIINPDHPSISNADDMWKMTIGRSIIVPIMNSENPYLDEIQQKGIARNDFEDVFSNKSMSTWGSLLNNAKETKINGYCISEVATSSNLADYLETDLNTINTLGVGSVEEILQKIKSDPYSIGFCRLSDVLNYENNDIKAGLSLIPIDINGNNKIDHFENIYNNTQEFERGIWIGKYPKDLYSNILGLASDQPDNIEELAFLEWIITEGQQYLNLSGYSELISSERQTKVQNLYAKQIPIADIHRNPVKSSNLLSGILLISISVLLGLAILLAISTLIYEAVQAIKILFFGKKEVEMEKIGVSTLFGENSLKVPGGLFFDKSHTWAFMEKDGLVKIGIDDFLQHVTGSITKVKMKHPGETVKKGEAFLSLIQQGKQINIKSPVSGIVREINTKLNTQSSILNSSPYAEGWVYVIESADWLKEIRSFIMGETYKSWLKDEFLRLKDFISSVIKPSDAKQMQIIMQDGGELNDRVLESLDPEIWEEFQIRFINTSK